MGLFVDTSVWSLALRRDSPPDDPQVGVLRATLARGHQVHSTGIVLLELLQGAIPATVAASIVRSFAAIDVIAPALSDYEQAARLSNDCRAAGVQLGTVDSLIAQLALSGGHELLTTDRDFTHAARHIPLRLWRAA